MQEIMVERIRELSLEQPTNYERDIHCLIECIKSEGTLTKESKNIINLYDIGSTKQESIFYINEYYNKETHTLKLSGNMKTIDMDNH